MATITIRNLPPKVVRSLKALARRNHRSMEQEARAILELHAGDRLSAIAQIERSWSQLKRSPSAREIDEWIDVGRP
jgi:hypothetical protein